VRIPESDPDLMDRDPLERALEEFDRDQLEILTGTLLDILSADTPKLQDYEREELESLCRESREALFTAVEELHKLTNRAEEVSFPREELPTEEIPRWALRKGENLSRQLDALGEPEGADDQPKGGLSVLRHYSAVRSRVRLVATADEEREQDPALKDARKMIRAVVEAAEKGTEWESGKELTRWLADEFPSSESTVQRRLEEVGVWVNSGQQGRTGLAVRQTVRRCVLYVRSLENSRTENQSS